MITSDSLESSSTPLVAMPTFTEPDYSQAKRFMDILHPNELITFQTVPQDEANIKAKMVHGCLDDVWDELVDWNRKGADIYFMVNGGDGKGRKFYNVTAFTTVFVSTHDQPLERIKALSIPPNVIVQTGPTRYQAYWRIIPVPITKQTRWQVTETFRRFQYQLSLKVGGVNLTDIAQVMDVPGFTNYRREPYQVRLIEWRTSVIPDISALTGSSR